MAATLTLSDEVLGELRPLFAEVEGSCEVWTDDEVLTRMLIRGVMAYGQTAGKDFAWTSALAGRIRAAVASTAP